MLDLILIAIGMLGLIVASITDIKTMEVPDWISYSMIASGLGIRLIYSIIEQSWNYFLYGALGFLILFGFGNLMYYTKQWGGGDSKLIMGLGALFATSNIYPNFLLGVIINILLIGAIYGVIWGFILAIKNWKNFIRDFKRELIKNKKILVFSLITSLIVITLAYIIIKDKFEILIISLIFLIVIFYYFLTMFVRSVENTCMLKKISSNKLTEGDWVAEDIYYKGKLIYNSKSLGVEKKQIEKIKKIKKKILVKYGIPFVPSFLIGFIITLIFGNLLFKLLGI